MSQNPQPSAGNARLLLIAVVIGAVAVFAVAMVAVFSAANAPITAESIGSAGGQGNTASNSGFYAGIPQGTFAAIGTPLLGSPDAKVILAEFSDFSCPGCAQYHTTIKQMAVDLVKGGQASITFMPMIFHGEPSLIAASAAMCANEQGKFWEMHDALFKLHEQRGGNAYTLPLVRDTAVALGLNADTLVKCITANKPLESLNKAYALAEEIKLQYTPTLVYSLDGGKTWKWFEKDGTIFDASVPLSVVAQTVESANRQ